VTACDPETKKCIEAAGGSVTRVYYEEEGLKALLHVSIGRRFKLILE
jgi:large subunit ribosomal protein L15